jgi:hypothetical protein
MSKNCKLETHKKHMANISKGRFLYSSREDVALAAVICSTYENDVRTESVAGALISKHVGLAPGTDVVNENTDGDWILVTKTKRHKMPRDEITQAMKMSKVKSKTTRDAMTKTKTRMVIMPGDVKAKSASETKNDG